MADRLFVSIWQKIRRRYSTLQKTDRAAALSNSAERSNYSASVSDAIID